MLCVIAVPRVVCVKQGELVMLLVCLRALQRTVEIKAAVETHIICVAQFVISSGWRELSLLPV